MNKKVFSVIGKPFRKVDAVAKCAGETRYADDIDLPRMLFSKLLRSPHPHANVRNIYTSKAEALDGVYGIITGVDLPEKFGILPSTQDEEAMATEKVRYVGDPVAAVAAASEAIAEQALRLIEVDYEVLPPILSIEEALDQEDNRIHTWVRRANIHKAVSFEFGEVGEGFDPLK